MEIINTAQNIVMKAITVLIPMTETTAGKEITGITKITEMMITAELIVMKKEIIMTTPGTEGYMKDLNINPMC